jgi:hypothetical protein
MKLCPILDTRSISAAIFGKGTSQNVKRLKEKPRPASNSQ